MPIPSSEQMTASFWQTILSDKIALMGAALIQKMKEFGLVDDFGLSGDTGKFTVSTLAQSAYSQKVTA